MCNPHFGKGGVGLENTKIEKIGLSEDRSKGELL